VKGAQVAAFSAALTEAGCRLRERNGPGSYWVELPESGSTDLLLDAALRADLVVLELEPLFAPR
ncbi:MAG: hypothetical protein ABI488_19780, partial [Polyangiaceae bacterium]